MARRGQFGRSAAGSSNLSATIQSLVREQKAQEESVFMNAFYNGTEFNGKIPTISDVIKFYENVASIAGIEKNSTDWNAISQKIDAANNFDIKRTYNSLITEFNLNGGENYDQVLSFLRGRAMDSTDSNDKDDYRSAIDSTTNAYIGLLGTRLSQGRIDLQEYRSVVDIALSQLAPGSESYNSALNSAKITEWNTEKSKMDNRLAAGKINYSEYANWARTFRDSLLSSGIERDSELMTSVQATIAANAQRASAAAASAAVAKAEKGAAGSTASILNLYAIAATQAGVPVNPTTLDKLSKGDPFTIEDVISNPEVIASYMRLVDSGAINIDERLVSIGLDDGTSIRTFYDSEIKSLVYNAKKVYASTGDKADLEFYQQAAKVYYRTGGASKLDEISDAATQFAADIQAAGNDDFALAEAFGNWAAYLSPILTGKDGASTKYGQLLASDLDNLVPPEFSQDQTILMAYLLNSAAVANGEMIPTDDQLTLEAAMNVTIEIDGKEYNIQDFYKNGSIGATLDNIGLLISGNAAQEISIVNGKVSTKTVGLPAIGPRGSIGGSEVAANSGRLNQITWREFGGQYIPIMQSVVAANEIQVPGIDVATSKPSLETWGYKYVLGDGKEIYVSIDGESYDQNPFSSVLGAGNDGVLVPVAGDGLNSSVSALPSVPVIDVESLIRAKGYQNNPVKLRDLAEELDKIVMDPNNPALQNMAQVLGSDLAEATAAAKTEIAKKADVIELKNLQIQSFRMTELEADPMQRAALNARILELQASAYGGKYNNQATQSNSAFLNFVVPNKDKYTEVEPGVWKLNEDVRLQQASATWNPMLGGAAVGAASLAPIGAPLGPVGMAVAGGIGAIAGGFLGQFNGGNINLPDVVNINPTKPIDYGKAEAAKLNYLGGSTPAAATPGSEYFRNLNVRPVATAQPVTTVAPKVLPSVSVATPTLPKPSINQKDLDLAKAYSLTAEGKAEAARTALVAKPGQMVAK